MGLVEQLGQERPGMVDNLTDQVNSMEIDGPAAEGAEGHDAARAHYFGTVFAEVPPPALAAPARTAANAQAPTPQ
uniref:Uncharacterized protein n=1 Tax=Setaria italica TaxID=4555 RepID=K4AN00_SETIT